MEPTREVVEYAGFWRRVAASFFDGAVIAFIGLGLRLGILGIGLLGIIPLPQMTHDFVPLFIFWLYPSLMESGKGQGTIGKRILGINVTDTDGGRISFLRATGRTFATLLSTLTFGVGFLMIAFTKRKQGLHDMVSKTLVVKRGESRVWKVILVFLVSFLIFIGAAGTYGYFFLWPNLKKYFSTKITILKEPDKISPLAPQKEAVVLGSKGVVSFSEAEYDGLLSRPMTGLKGTHVGPAVLEISNFWEGDEPSLWINVMLPALPNFNFNQSLTKVTINNVQNKNGQSVYDSASAFEKAFFQSFNVWERSSPILHLQGTRQVHLISGTKEKDVFSIEGTLVLSLPIGIKELSFSPSDIGSPKESAGVSINVSAIQNSQVLWTYQGKGIHFFKLSAYNSQGQELGMQLGSSPIKDKDYTNPSSLLKSIFSGDIALVKVFIVPEIKEREYPFIIQKQ